MNLSQFMATVAKDTYPEPRTGGHDKITSVMAPKAAALIPASGRVLDIGCGQGPALEWFTNRGFRAHGIALNETDVRECTRQGYSATIGDQNDLSEQDGAYDLVWARHVLEHSIAPYWTLHELARVLKKGGILYVEVPSPDTDSRHETNQNHYSVMGWKMWCSLISRAGFDIVAAETISLTTGAGSDVYFTFIARKL